MNPWRRFHDAVAERLDQEPVHFLNYGLRGPENWIPVAEQGAKYHLNLVRRVLRGVDLAGRRVLEIGSGRGGNCAYLAQHTSAGEIYAVDRCAGYLRACQRLPSCSRVKLLRADSEMLPLREACVDVVLNIESAHCYPRFDVFLAEVTRVLRPGGMFCLSDLWDIPFPGIDWTSRAQALAASALLGVAEADLSRDVFEALEAPDGLPATLTRLQDPAGDSVVDHLRHTTELVRLSLAIGECRYRLWQMQKPVQVDDAQHAGPASVAQTPLTSRRCSRL